MARSDLGGRREGSESNSLTQKQGNFIRKMIVTYTFAQ